MNVHDFARFIQIWIFPPGLILLLLFIGTLIGKRLRSAGQAVCIFSVVLLWVLSTPVIAQILINVLQDQYPTLTNVSSPHDHAAIVVLGSGIENAKEYESKHALSAISLSRLLYGAYLHNKLHAPIIVSGGNRDRNAHTEANLMGDLLHSQFSITPLAREERSRNTGEESRLLLPVVKAKDLKALYLVTNAWHMPRSIFAFQQSSKRLGIDMTIIPAPMGYIQLISDDQKANYLPSIRALNASVYALHEYVGLLWYRMTL